MVAAAIQYCRAQHSPKRVATFVCDSGNKYLSKMFNDYWMADHGFAKRQPLGDLRDVISPPLCRRRVVCVAPDEPLAIAYQRMRMYDISQLPVIDHKRIVGILDESDLLLAASTDVDAFGHPCRERMTTQLETVSHRRVHAGATATDFQCRQGRDRGRRRRVSRPDHTRRSAELSAPRTMRRLIKNSIAKLKQTSGFPS